MSATTTRAAKAPSPTPEVIEDILRRMERTVARLNAGIIADDTHPVIDE